MSRVAVDGALNGVLWCMLQGELKELRQQLALALTQSMPIETAVPASVYENELSQSFTGSSVTAR